MQPNKHLIIAPDNPPPQDLADCLEVEVIKVYDGDGFAGDVWHPIRQEWIPRVPFRFAFIDAPEMQQPFGPEAQEVLHQLISGKRLRLDPVGKESTAFLPIDQYKRVLCTGYLTEDMHTGNVAYFMNGACGEGVVSRARPVTRNVELEMIINGWAWVVEQYTFDREEEYRAAQESAQRHRRGLWATDNPEAPWKFKQRQKRQRKAAERQPSLFVNRCEIEQCDGTLVEREGANGLFLGCSNFPRCRYSRAV